MTTNLNDQMIMTVRSLMVRASADSSSTRVRLLTSQSSDEAPACAACWQLLGSVLTRLSAASSGAVTVAL